MAQSKFITCLHFRMAATRINKGGCPLMWPAALKFVVVWWHFHVAGQRAILEDRCHHTTLSGKSTVESGLFEL